MKSSTVKVWVSSNAINSARLQCEVAENSAQAPRIFEPKNCRLTLIYFVIRGYFVLLVQHLAVWIQAATSHSKCVKIQQEWTLAQSAAYQMMQNCEPYGRAMEGGGGLHLIKHIHTHNGEVGQRGEERKKEKMGENCRDAFLVHTLPSSWSKFLNCIHAQCFLDSYMKALHHLVK